VRVSDHPELGEILVNGEGMTPYVFDDDTGETASSCHDGCAEA
jgi:predicted lipoprotein with Yx(FWY)xxD motif